MWELQSPWYEPAIRGFVIYMFFFIIIRLLGKKHLSQLAPFDFVLLLIMSEAVQNAMIGDDSSLTAAFILVGVLVGMNVLMNELTYRSKTIENFIEGKAQILIEDGAVVEKILIKEKITTEELNVALRKQGVAHIKEVKCAVLEKDGDISVIKY